MDRDLLLLWIGWIGLLIVVFECQTMSYDYDALVRQIGQARQTAAAAAAADSTTTSTTASHVERVVGHLDEALQLFQELAAHCPMTPRLWIQYAATVVQRCRAMPLLSAVSAPLSSAVSPVSSPHSIMQQALQQFPGSALLHLYHCYCCDGDGHHLVDEEEDKTNDQDHHPTITTTTTTTATTTNNNNNAPPHPTHKRHALELAIQHLGQGLHGHGSVVATLVASLYLALARLQWQSAHVGGTTTTTTTTLLKKKKNNNNNGNVNGNANHSASNEVQAAQATLIRRALEPLDNDALTTLAQEWECQTNDHDSHTTTTTTTTMTTTMTNTNQTPPFFTPELEARLDRARRWTARNRAQYASYENDLQIALQRQGMVEVLTKTIIKPEDDDDDIAVDWDALIRPSDDNTVTDGSSLLCGMGTGNLDTAKAFVQYAQAVARDAQREWRQALNNNNNNNDDDGDDDDVDRALHPQRSELVLLLYERGIAECPTVERIWLSYLAHVTHCIQFWRQQQESSPEATTTTNTTAMLRIATYASRLESIGQRAVRNCPYSVALVQERLRAHLLQAHVEHTVFDPDLLLEWIQTAWDRKFFVPSGPGTFWTLYATAVRMVTRRILTLLTPRRSKGIRSYDDAEEVVDDRSKTTKTKASSSKPSGDDDDDEEWEETAEQELDDLVDDLDDMYEEIERRMKKCFPSWSQGRALLAMDRAQLTTYLLLPLRRVREGSDENEDDPLAQPVTSIDPALAAWQKATRSCQPPHPDPYLGYIRCFQQVGSMKSPGAVARRIRQTRFLFQTAVHAVGQAKKTPSGAEALLLRDYPTALSELCHAWTEFESLLGSEESLDRAKKAIHKKWEKTVATSHGQSNQRRPIQSRDELGAPALNAGEHEATSQQAQVAGYNQESSSTAKRKPEANLDAGDRPPKRTKRAPLPESNASVKQGENVQEVQEEREERALKASVPAKEVVEIDKSASVVQKPLVHKVRIGKLEYPAHPFTVRISHLSPQTDDMDLVDLLRPKCGAIVHARIIRDKGPPHAHHHDGPAAPKPKSKGWALVQFEERESVEKALALDDVIGLHEKVLRIERSHQPAATLVPPGMHRVNPKGDGKHSKRNEKKREAKAHVDGEDSRQESAKPPSGKAVAAISSETPSAQGEHAGTASGLSVLAFRPRGLQRKEHQKRRLNL